MLKLEFKMGEEENRKIYKEQDSNNNVISPGDLSRLPDDFFEVVVFIDNAYLIRLKNYFFSEKLKYSVRVFIEKIAKRNNYSVKKIYLYDSPPFQSEFPNDFEDKKKKLYDKFVSIFEKEGIVVREGRTQRLKVGENFVYRQKGVDMLLGIDMVGVLLEFPEIENVILLTGDSDFVPVIDKLNQQKINTILCTYFDRERKSPFSRCNELMKSVSKHIKLTKQDFEGAELRVEDDGDVKIGI